MMHECVLLVFLTLLHVSWQKFLRYQNSVGCYKCHSLNGSDASCGDPFHPAYNIRHYHAKCEQGLDNRIGMFPARFCTKIKGTNLATNVELIVRSCSLAPFDNACGLFEFENARYSGCLMSCSLNACNSAASPVVNLSTLLVSLLCGLALTRAQLGWTVEL